MPMLKTRCGSGCSLQTAQRRHRADDRGTSGPNSATELRMMMLANERVALPTRSLPRAGKLTMLMIPRTLSGSQSIRSPAVAAATIMSETARDGDERYIGKNSRCRVSPRSSGLWLDHGAEVIACVRASGRYVAEARGPQCRSVGVTACARRQVRGRCGCCGLSAGSGEVQPQFQVATGASWAAVDFVIAVFLPRRARGPEAGGGGAGVLLVHAGAGRFSPSSRSRPERAGRRWTSSLRCSFRGGRPGPELAGAVRVLRSTRRSGEVQPQVQVATGASWAAVEFVIAVFLPRRAPRARSWRGRCGGAAGPRRERGGSAPVPGRDRSELGGGGLRHCGVPSEAGPRARSWRGRCGGAAGLTQGAGRVSPSSRSRPERAGRRWISSLRCSFRGGPEGPKLAGAVRGAAGSRGKRGGSAPVPGRDRSELARRGGPLLGGVLGEHRLDSLDDRLHGAFPFTRCLTPRGAGHWPGAAVVAGTSVDFHRLRG